MKALGKGSVASIIRIGLLITWIGLWFAAVALLVAAVAYAVMLALISSGIANSATLRLDESFGNPSDIAWPVVLSAFLAGSVAIGGALVIVWRLRRLFASFTSGEPFRRENATHLRVIWITMLVIEISRYLVLALASVLLATYSPGEGVRAEIEATFDVTTWASILILIVLAEVFREGARLKEEQELTI